MAGAPDPKPARRIVDPSAGLDKIRREGRCRGCGLISLPTKDGGLLNRAHIVPRSQGGDDVEENIIGLCGSGTSGCHGAFDGQTQTVHPPSCIRGAPRIILTRGIWLHLGDGEREYQERVKGPTWWERRFM